MKPTPLPPQDDTEAVSRRNFLTRTLIAVTGGLLGLPAWSVPVHSLVEKGDTLDHIARRYAITVKELKQANGLTSDLIHPGQQLSIPAPSNRPATPLYTQHVRSASISLLPKQRDWRMLVIHHSAVDKGNAAQYDAAHRLRGMKNGLAYHFVIGNGRGSGDGEIEIGPRWLAQQAGGHVRKESVNAVAIGIALVGNFENYPPSRRQLAALDELLHYLQRAFLPRYIPVMGHRDLDRTLCPGRNFPLTRFKNAN